jgi:hypothetical protein
MKQENVFELMNVTINEGYSVTEILRGEFIHSHSAVQYVHRRNYYVHYNCTTVRTGSTFEL